MQRLRTVLWLGLVLGLVWAGWSFRSGNAGVIDLDLVWVRIHNVEVWRALAAAVAAGASFGGLCVGVAWLRQRLLNRRHRKAIARLEGEVKRLRSLPVAADGRGGLDEPAAGTSIGRG